MARINPKLNLNKTPQNAEDYSLVFAKNIKVTSDGSISRENNIYKLLQDHDFPHTKILTCVPHNNKLYIVYVQNMSDSYIGSKMRIATYDESIEYTIYQAQKVKPISTNSIETALIYHGGLVDGFMSVNLRGQRLLTINEYFESEDDENYKDVPLRTVNVDECSDSDDESIYTQTPKMPICNLNLKDTYHHTIPNGAYQFFIRWEIHKNHYTNWLPCSKVCFTGNHNELATQAGSVLYTDELVDSPYSFIFNLEQVNPTVDKSKFLSYQLGFILSHDDDVLARSWKKFDVNETIIYFAYEQNDIEEINIDDLLTPIYDIFNVKNVINFKTNLYASNYKETDFNPDLVDFVTENAPVFEGLSAMAYSNRGGDNASFTYKTGSSTLIESIDWVDSDNTTHTDDVLDYHDRIYVDKHINYFLRLPKNVSNDPDFEYYNLRDEGNTLVQQSSNQSWLNEVIGVLSPIDSGATTHVGQCSIISESISLPYVNLISANINEHNFAGFADCHFTNDSDIVAGLENIRKQDKRFSSEFGVNEFSVLSSLITRVINDWKALTPGERATKTVMGVSNTIRRFYKKDSKTELDSGTTTWLNIIGSGGTTSYLTANGHITNPSMLLRTPLQCGTENIAYFYKDNPNTDFTREFEYITHQLVGLGPASKGSYVYLDGDDIGLCGGSTDFVFNGAYAVSIKVWVEANATEGAGGYGQSWFHIGHDEDRLVICYQIIRHEYTYNFASFTPGVGLPYVLMDNVQTLLPYNVYNFYIHYIKDSGEITNGYRIPISFNGDDPVYDYEIDIDTMIAAGYEKPSGDIDYSMSFIPIFSKATIPEGYCAYFITFRHIANDIIHVINNKQMIKAVYDGNNNSYTGNAHELDLRLYSQIAQYSAIDFNKQIVEGRYNHSSDTTNAYLFGNSGKFVTNPTNAYPTDEIFIRIESNYDNISKTLIKCTPYISATSDVNTAYKNLQLDGYICKVSKFLDTYTHHPHHTFEPNESYDITGPSSEQPNVGEDNYYSDGEVYYKNVSTVSEGGNTLPVIDLEHPLKHITPGDDGILPELLYTNYKSFIYLIYSKYNLNFLQLRDTISPKIIRADKDKSYTVYNLNSLIFSDTYKFPSMYKDFTRPVYSQIDLENNYIRFENTIRKSTQLGDEDKQYNYYFNPVDYYNIPTNKGIIVKLISTGEAILVHTKDSIFKFSGNNTITANGGEDVQLQENNVFDTGVSELFGSEHGFGGLQNKYHSAISQAGYLFYDASCYKVYFFNGQSNIKTISDSIQKIMDTYKFDDVAIANDYFNNRMILCFSKTKLVDEEEVSTFLTISYSLITQDWCSLHDYRFNKAYCTKNRCYVSLALDSENKPNSKVSAFYNIYEIYEQDGFDIPLELKFVDTIFPHYPYWTNFATAKLYCIVDIIVKGNYEQLKSLDSISWICNKVLSYSNYDNNNGLIPYDVNASLEIVPIGFAVAEENMYADITNQTDVKKDDGVYVTNPYDRYKGDAIWIYSDSCFSDLINVLDKSNNKLNNPNSHKYPRYNSGIWSLNYFRNAKGLNINGEYVSDNSSLIYGKYFVIRFIFNPDNNFKLENLIANFNNYIG